MKKIIKQIKFIPVAFLLLVSCEKLELAPENQLPIQIIGPVLVKRKLF